MVNLNESNETTPMTTTALKVEPYRTTIHKNWNHPFLTKIYLVKVPLNVTIVDKGPLVCYF